MARSCFSSPPVAPKRFAAIQFVLQRIELLRIGVFDRAQAAGQLILEFGGHLLVVWVCWVSSASRVKLILWKE